ncbi:hypothetical protein D3C75_799940 [compost metagenome]
MQINHPYTHPSGRTLSSDENERKYPLKWAICYRGKPYISLYGKKKAYDLLYKLNQTMLGLTVIPLEPGGSSGGKTLGGVMKQGRQLVQRYERVEQEG